MQLSNEARILSNTLDRLILPADKAAKEGEYRMKKRIQDHRKALNMLPDADSFRAELMQFQ